RCRPYHNPPVDSCCLAWSCFPLRELPPSPQTAGRASEGSGYDGTYAWQLLAQFNATVLSPGLLVVTGYNRTLFTVGHQLQLSRGYALQHQVALNGLGT